MESPLHHDQYRPITGRAPIFSGPTGWTPDHCSYRHGFADHRVVNDCSTSARPERHAACTRSIDNHPGCHSRSAYLASSSVRETGSRHSRCPQSRNHCDRSKARRCRPRVGCRFLEVAAVLAVLRVTSNFRGDPLTPQLPSQEVWLPCRNCDATARIATRCWRCTASWITARWVMCVPDFGSPTAETGYRASRRSASTARSSSSSAGATPRAAAIG